MRIAVGGLRLAGGLLCGGFLMGVAAVCPAAEIVTNPVPLPNPENAVAAPVPALSPGLADILKLVSAKVDGQVIKAFIRNSQVPYNPSAEEILTLKNRGVSDDILTALMQRGGELRAQGAQAAPPAPSPGPSPGGYAGTPGGVAPAYPYDYGDYGAWPSYPGYSYYAYPYSYPYYYNYWWYNYGYPWWSWSWYSPYYSSFCGYRYGWHYPYYGHRGSWDRHGTWGRDGQSWGSRGGNFGPGGNWGSRQHPPFANNPQPQRVVTTYSGRTAGLSGAVPRGGISRPTAITGTRSYPFAGGSNYRSVGGFGGRSSGFVGSSGGVRASPGFSGRSAGFGGMRNSGGGGGRR